MIGSRSLSSLSVKTYFKNMELGRYYLNIPLVSKMESEEERQRIHDYYKEMMYSYHDGRAEMAKSMMLTLLKSGYLIDEQQESREKNINMILDGDKG